MTGRGVPGDLDAFLAAHARDWERLAELTRRARRPPALGPGEVDELVEGYQRAATNLSVIRSRYPDPAAIERLSVLVSRARAAIVGSRDPGWHQVARFLTETWPAAVYTRWRWCAGAALGFLAVALATGAWVAHSVAVQGAIATPAGIRAIVDHGFANYYRSAPAAAFAARVWTNNAVVAAEAISFGVLLGLPTLVVLALNGVNVGVDAGLLVGHGRAAEFFVLVLPHGMLELTAVFIAAGTGLRLGWTIVDPGPSSRAAALGREARGAVAVAVGLVGVLAVSGAIEAFVTPSPLPAALRLGIGAAVEVAFLGVLGVLGRRGAHAGRDGDLPVGLGGDRAPEWAAFARDPAAGPPPQTPRSRR